MSLSLNPDTRLTLYRKALKLSSLCADDAGQWKDNQTSRRSELRRHSSLREGRVGEQNLWKKVQSGRAFEKFTQAKIDFILSKWQWRIHAIRCFSVTARL